MQAIYEEKRALGLMAEGRVGVGAMSMPDGVAERYEAEIRRGTHNPTGDGLDIFDPRGQAEYEGRVDWSGNDGVSDPIFSPEHAAEIAVIAENIASLEEAIENAEDGVVKFGNGLIVPIETAERLKDELGGNGGLKDKLNEVTGATEEWAFSEAWGEIKDNLEGLIFQGQSWADTWQGIFGSVSDKLFDLAFSPAWGTLWANLEGVISSASGGNGNPLGDLISGATGWVGNILGLDTGGDAKISGKGGIDRNLTVLRTSDAETVSVRRPGQAGAMGAPVNVYIQTPDPQAFQSSRAQIGHQIARAVAAGNRAT